MTVNIPSDFDPTANPAPTPTTTIYFNLTVAGMCSGQAAAPLVISAPGWGGNRVGGPAPNDTLYPNDPMSQAEVELFEALPYYGFTTISFDPRGFGQSVPANGGGNVRNLDPAAEIQDVRALLDWVYDHADQYGVLTEPNSGVAKDLRVGALGFSYGASFQLTLGALDERIDALVPMAAWHDLEYSLFPGNAVKLGWNGLLCEGAAKGGMVLTPLMSSLCDLVGPANDTASANGLRSESDLLAAIAAPKTQPRAIAATELLGYLFTHNTNYFVAQQRADQSWGASANAV